MGVAPPKVGVAVKVTLLPLHIDADGLAAMLISASGEGFIIIVIAFDVAGEPLIQLARDDIITQVMTSPLASVFEV